MIDLHLHTTASDGLLSPTDLVSRAASCGLRTISVTDHDTCAGLAEAGEAARRLGLRAIPGVEITAIEDGRDAHMLAYFVDTADASFDDFLTSQRSNRIERIREIAGRLDALGCPLDIAALLNTIRERHGRSVGRPQIADALISAGHVRDRDDAFERLLGIGRPAFVARRGPSPEAVISIVAKAGGIVSMAHPGLTALDHLIPRLAAVGLQAIEARHSEHDAATEARYRQLAAHLGLAISGGSDFHGDVGRRATTIGRVTLSADELAALEARRS